MKKIINTLSKAIQVVLAAPVVLPMKVLNIVKYVAIGLGILDAVIEDDEAESPTASADAEEGADAPAE